MSRMSLWCNGATKGGSKDPIVVVIKGPSLPHRGSHKGALVTVEFSMVVIKGPSLLWNFVCHYSWQQDLSGKKPF
jgi:hypothetical protein